MNPETPALFSATRKSHSLGLVVAGAIFALVGLGGSGAIARNFVTAGSFAAAPVPAAVAQVA
jgi:hypothetical protein